MARHEEVQLTGQWINRYDNNWDYQLNGETFYQISECHRSGPSRFYAGHNGLGRTFDTLVDAMLTVEDWAAGRGACPRWEEADA